MLAKNINIFFKKKIFLQQNIFKKIIIKKLWKYHYYCTKITLKKSLFFGLKFHYFSFHDFPLHISKSYLSNVSLCSFNMALFSLLSLDILSFFERFFPQHSFFTQGSKFLLFKCIIMCPLKFFSCPLGYICFGSNINSFQHASNTYGRKNIQRNMFLSFSQILLFPVRIFYMVLQHTHVSKNWKLYLQGCLLDKHT